LIAQSNEINYSFYDELLNILKDKHFTLPESLQQARIKNKDLRTFNMGIFGGTDLPFIQQYCRNMYRFYYLNREQFSSNDIGKLNVLDQVCFYMKAIEEDKKIALQLWDTDDFSALMLFHLVPGGSKYIHLLGGAKKNEFYNKLVALQLQYEFPEHYHRINEMYKDKKETSVLQNINIDLNSSFKETIQILQFFIKAPESASLKNYDDFLKATELLQEAVKNEETFRVLTNVIAFEQCRYLLSLKKENMPDDEAQFEHFRKARILLEHVSPENMDKLFDAKLILAPHVSTLATEIDVLALIINPNWLEDLHAGNIPEEEQHIYLFVKYASDTIITHPLGDLSQLLYYYNGNAITGRALEKYLLEDDEEPESAKEQYHKLIYHFISNNLITTGYLIMSD